MDEKLKQAIALGREHYAKREYDKAERHLKRVVESGEYTFPDVLNMLGVIQHDRGCLEEARDAFRRALEVNPHYTEAALNLAVTCNDLGDYDQAQNVYHNALHRSSQGPGPGDNFARGKIANLHAEVAQAYLDIGMPYEAIEQYRNAIRLCPRFADLRVKLAEIYQQQGDFVAAKYELMEATHSRPEYTRARIALGVVLLVTGQREQAMREWEKALEQDPQARAAEMYLRMAQDAANFRPSAPPPEPSNI